MKSKKFISFQTQVDGIELPKKFTFPFYYEPHRLSEIAALELQKYLETQTDFTHNFGLSSTSNELPIGKMFGVLVVQNQQNEIGYLAAFSGKLADNSCPEAFVPPVFNIREKGSFFLKGEEEIGKINEHLAVLTTDNTYIALKKEFTKMVSDIETDLSLERKKLKRYKKERKEKKESFRKKLSEKEYEILCKKLTQESYNNQFYIKELQEYYQTKIDKKRKELAVFEDKINTLKKLRKEKSNALQQYIFTHYNFLNQQKEVKNLLDIFGKKEVPPAGSGECAAPKLLQFAFANDLKPVCMAEFWWGVSPNSEVRKHKHFYPACQSRCKPILGHMLKGMKVDDDVITKNLSKNKKVITIYEDYDLAIVNKPAELLTVPGKEITDSVYSRMKEKYPKATGPLIVHRLDMSTSGILLIAKTKEAYHFLQHQFIKRTIKKRYVAVLDGKLENDTGKIELPLRVDLDDRPRQLVCFEHGKRAETLWEVIERTNNSTRVHFYPITGRTHQLRVHAAHKDGLNTPILGDDLYGKKANRLHLHAEYISFIHPTTKEEMSFTVPAEF